MTTNVEILAFLKSNQEALARERQEDKLLRVKERQEDMDHILSMIKKGVQNEVKQAVQAIEERLEIQERVNQDLCKKLQCAMTEIDNLRSSQVVQDLSRDKNISKEALEELNNTEEVLARPTQQEELCASARKVLGFSPIEPRMLDLQINSYGAKDIEEAKLMEVKNYLKCELKMKPSEIENLNFKRIFPPAKGEWKVLYVEFTSDTQVDKVISHTKNMDKQDHRVVRWYSWQMYDRFRAVESLAYDLRKVHNKKTRVKTGKDDLELFSKDSGSSVWKKHVLPENLPEFVLKSSQIVTEVC